MLAFYRKSSTVTPLKLSMALRPSIFWGEHEDDVEVWLDNFESCAKSNGWPRYNWPRLAYLYLSDTWQSWFSAHPHLANGKWRVFRREFSRAVGPPNRHHLLLNTWRQFTRKPEESAYAHAHRFYSYLLFQLAEPSRSEFLDRYLVVIYRKTRAVVDDVGSELAYGTCSIRSDCSSLSITNKQASKKESKLLQNIARLTSSYWWDG
ncbi:hypothetical protein BDF22DRAFT_732365 [Syncephalis plumigaleata]|nr:hypothetical protein BDF22DRAFT_732365 [Syncephalis plumigaleata]